MLMGVGAMEAITREIWRGQAPDLPVALVRWGTRQQKTIVGTFATIAEPVRASGF